MPIAKPETSDARVIAHIDMDCFYVQVEQRKRPELRGLPTAVVQYNSWKGGALIAVGYEARKFGVKRSMRGDEAKSACPEIQLVQVPVAHNKADLNSYRDAGSEVVAVLSKRGRCERASIDEVYLDLTEAAETLMAGRPPENLEVIEDGALKSHILGLSHEDVSDAKENVRKWLCRSDADDRDKLLACGALIVADLRMKVLKETEFTCSAGIAHNKMLAKLASAMNKPAQQTVVPSASVEGLLNSFPIRKMKQLGGKLGISLQNDMGINTVGDLLQYSKQKLQDRYGINTGAWLWNIARGIDGEEVQGRLLPKSHGSGKTFPGPRALKTISSVQQWLNELCEELHERLCSDLEKNKRMAQTLTLHARAYKQPNDLESDNKFPSKSCPLRHGTSKIQEDALNLFQAGLREYMGASSVKTQGTKCSGWGITGLSISASKIVSIPSGTNSIMKYFSGPASGKSKERFTQEDVLFSSTGSDSLAGCDSSEIEIPGQEAFNLDQKGVERETLTEQLANFVGRTTSTDQVPSNFPTRETEDGVTPEPSVFSTAENCSRLDPVEQKEDSSVREYRITTNMPTLEQKGHKRNTSKDKGQEIPSILKFFKNDNGSCSSQLDHVKTTQSSQNDYGMEAWRYKIDEIDTSVLDELPPEIQEEVQMWLRPQKKANTVHRRSNITHYFAPSRST